MWCGAPTGWILPAGLIHCCQTLEGTLLYRRPRLFAAIDYAMLCLTTNSCAITRIPATLCRVRCCSLGPITTMDPCHLRRPALTDAGPNGWNSRKRPREAGGRRRSDHDSSRPRDPGRDPLKCGNGFGLCASIAELGAQCGIASRLLVGHIVAHDLHGILESAGFTGHQTSGEGCRRSRLPFGSGMVETLST